MQEGDVVPIVFASNENCVLEMQHAETNDVPGRPLQKYDAMSARIIKLYYSEEDMLASKHSIATSVSEKDDRKATGGNPVGADIVYMADGALEPGVDLRYRLVLSTDSTSPRPLLNAIKDIMARLGDTVPNRPTFLTEVERAIDADGLLLQMLSRRGVATPSDIVNGVLQPLIASLQSLQAENKSEMTITWWNAFKDSNHLQNIEMISSDAAFDRCIRNLPAFFEFMSACIDDLRRDIANFYVSQLAIALQSTGPSYLGDKLSTRCTEMAMQRKNVSLESGGVINLLPEEIFPKTYTLLTSVLSATDTNNETERAVITELNTYAGITVFIYL